MKSEYQVQEMFAKLGRKYDSIIIDQDRMELDEITGLIEEKKINNTKRQALLWAVGYLKDDEFENC